MKNLSWWCTLVLALPVPIDRVVHAHESTKRCLLPEFLEVAMQHVP
jgi:hypothetical protein